MQFANNLFLHSYIHFTIAIAPASSHGQPPFHPGEILLSFHKANRPFSHTKCTPKYNCLQEGLDLILCQWHAPQKTGDLSWLTKVDMTIWVTYDGAPHKLETCHISGLRVHHKTIVVTLSYEGNRYRNNMLGSMQWVHSFASWMAIQ